MFKSQKGRLVVYIPQDVVSELGLAESDEVGFFRGKGRSYIFVKSSDVGSMLSGEGSEPAVKLQSQQPQLTAQLSDQDLEVLKKIDTIRYENRTTDNINKVLDEKDRSTLQMLILSGVVGKFRKNGRELYSISKQVYDRYLMRKKPAAPQQPAPFSPSFKTSIASAARQKGQERDQDIESLEKNGFVVLSSEAETSRVSLILEQSIRRGQVLGTRSFSKDREFYIVIRNYFDRYGSVILKKLRERGYRVAELSKELGMPENGARAVLYLLAESGDVLEKKRDTFTLA